MEPIDRELAQGIGSGAVLHASQQEKDTLNRMRRGVFDTGSRSTRDMQAQAGDLEYQRGQTAADAAAVRQRGEIAAQGVAQRGIEAEKVKGATAEREAALALMDKVAERSTAAQCARGRTLGADKNYDMADFVTQC